MTSGITTRKMTKEIQNIHINEKDLISIYGFGSFFRTRTPNDCDLLLIINNNCTDLGSTHEHLSKIFSDLGDQLLISFDLTILTEKEHEGQPLIEHNVLIPISIDIHR